MISYAEQQLNNTIQDQVQQLIKYYPQQKQEHTSALKAVHIIFTYQNIISKKDQNLMDDIKCLNIQEQHKRVLMEHLMNVLKRIHTIKDELIQKITQHLKQSKIQIYQTLQLKITQGVNEGRFKDIAEILQKQFEANNSPFSFDMFYHENNSHNKQFKIQLEEALQGMVQDYFVDAALFKEMIENLLQYKLSVFKNPALSDYMQRQQIIQFQNKAKVILKKYQKKSSLTSSRNSIISSQEQGSLSPLSRHIQKISKKICNDLKIQKNLPQISGSQILPLKSQNYSLEEEEFQEKKEDMLATIIFPTKSNKSTKKIYMLIKSQKQHNLTEKIRLRSNKDIIKPSLTTVNSLNLLRFDIQKQDKSFQILYREKQKQKQFLLLNVIINPQLIQQNHFIFEQLDQNILPIKPFTVLNPFELYLLYNLTLNQKEFLDLQSFVFKKQNNHIKQKIINEIINHKNLDIKYNQIKNLKFYYYALAFLHQDLSKNQTKYYIELESIESLFRIELFQQKLIDTGEKNIQNLVKYHILLLKCIIKLSMNKSQQKYVKIMSQYLNYFINDFKSHNQFVIQILYKLVINKRYQHRSFLQKSLEKTVKLSDKGILINLYNNLVSAAYYNQNSLVSRLVQTLTIINALEKNRDVNKISKEPDYKKHLMNIQNLIGIIYRQKKFKFEEVSSFKTFYSIIFALDPQIRSIFLNPLLKQKINISLKQKCNQRKQDLVQLLKIIFLDPKTQHFFNFQEFIQYINLIFSEKIQQPLYDNLLKKIVYKVINSENISLQQKTLLFNIVRPSLDYFQDFKKFVEKLNFQQKIIESSYEPFKKFYDSVLKNFQKTEQPKIYTDIILDRTYKELTKLSSLLKNIILQNFTSTMKIIFESNKEKNIIIQIDKVLNLEQQNNEFKKRVANIKKLVKVNKEQIRGAIFKDRNNLNMLSSIIDISQNKAVKEQFIHDIQKKEITMKQLKCILDSNPEQINKINDFFGGSNVQNLAKGIMKQVTQTKQKYQKIEDICSQFKCQFTSQIKKITKQQRQFFNKDVKISQFQTKNQIKPFLDLKQKQFEFTKLDFFKTKVQDVKFGNPQDFCKTIKNSFNEAEKRIDIFQHQFVQNKLTYKETKKLFKDIKNDEIDKILKINPKFKLQDIKEIKQLHDFIEEPKKFHEFREALTFFVHKHDIIDFAQPLASINNAFNKIQQSKFDEIAPCELAKDLSSFKETITRFKINPNQKQMINILTQTYKNQQLLQYIKNIKREQIQQLKDYINDEESANLDYKNIIELEKVHNFYNQIYQKANDFQTFCVHLQQQYIHPQFDQSRIKPKKIPQQKQIVHENLNINNNIDEDLIGTNHNPKPKKKIVDQFKLSDCLKNCAVMINQYKKHFSEANNRENMFKFNVMEIMQLSKITISHKSKTQQKELLLEIINVENRQNKKQKKYTVIQLRDLKDKCMLLLASSKKDKINQKHEIQIMQKYVKLYDQMKTLISQYEKLIDLGYVNNFVANTKAELSEIKFQIKGADYDGIVTHNLDVKKQSDKWQKKIEKSYEDSEALCNFQGKQLKRIVRKIINSEYDTIFQEVIPNLSKQKFQQYVGRNPQEFENIKKQGQAENQLQFFKNLLKYYQQKNQMLHTRSRNQKMEVKYIFLQQKRAYSGLLQVHNFKQLHINKILFCQQNSSYYQIKTFLYRAFHTSLPHIIIGVHYLNPAMQIKFCQIIQSFLTQQKKEKGKNMKLYFIDNNTLTKIYSFLNTHKQIKITSVNDSNKDHNQFFKRVGKTLKIVSSKRSCLGKTFWINRDMEILRLTKKFYFPISGHLNWGKLCQRIKNLKLVQNAALIFQISNVKNKKILDQFLFQIIMFKAVIYEGFEILPSSTYIYIQLQNTSEESFFDNYQTLQIFQKQPQFQHHIQQLKPKDIYIPKKNSKHMFVLKYLQTLKNKKINQQQITYQKFQKQYQINDSYVVPQKQFQQLLQEYLIVPLIKENNNPSFTQLQSFLNLLFESISTFAKSPFFTIDQMTYYHSQASKFGFNTFRQRYVHLLVSNAREFIIRTVTLQNFKNNIIQQENLGMGMTQSFNKKLRNFPFIVLNNYDNQNFSFVYNDDKNLDILIKTYLVIQSGKIKSFEQINNAQFVNKIFDQSLSLKSNKQKLTFRKNLEEYFYRLTGKETKPDHKYSLTLDNFFKICLIIQRMRAGLPIVIMGETGVGKTALINYLVKNVFDDDIQIINIHAGVTQQNLIQHIEKLKKMLKKSEQANKRLWVFFDEFNTTQAVGLIKQIVMDHRFFGEQLSKNFIFLAACNPFRRKQNKKNKNNEIVGIDNTDRKKRNTNDQFVYKVLPPPESMVEIMWNFQSLKKEELKQYIIAILQEGLKKQQVVIQMQKSIRIKNKDLKQSKNLAMANAIYETHTIYQMDQELNTVNLRDVSRFKILYNWFLDNMPREPVEQHLQTQKDIDYKYNYRIKREQRAFIISFCFCYILRLKSFQQRQKHLNIIQKIMNYSQGHMRKVLQNEQIDYLSRMQRQEGIAFNLAVRQNVFTTLVCILNYLPVIIVGKPGCSKSLSIRLIVNNLKGSNSKDKFFQKFPEIQLQQFQGSQICTSKGVEQVFQKAQQNLKIYKENHTNKIPFILFDQIGLAELSIYNPLKVLHQYLEVGRTLVPFVGISNWELDASKMARFIVVLRPQPSQKQLGDTALKIFQKKDFELKGQIRKNILDLSQTYFDFIKNWIRKPQNDYPQFFGLRDFYNVVKYAYNQLSKLNQNEQKSHQIIKQIIMRATQRNFDGRPTSVQQFLLIFQRISEIKMDGFKPTDIIQLVKQNLHDNTSRSLLQIIKGEALIHILNKINIKQNNTVITIYGSTFEDDRQSEEYSLMIISDIMNYVSNGYILILKDIPNSVQTSLYDLLNKSYLKINNKYYCSISVGANYKPKCIVNPDFNCIVYLMESSLRQVDPPFLNRFQKHYLQINQFIYKQQLIITDSLQEWIKNICIIPQNSPLFLEHLIVNICRQSLGTLAIELLLPHKYKADPNIKQMIQIAKKKIFMNSTDDFIILYQAKLIKQKIEIIENYIQDKKKMIKNLLSKKLLNTIIFTYDQLVEIEQNNIIYIKGRTSIIKICDVKTEKDLRTELVNFFQKDELQICQIKFDYEKEYKHLSLVLFLIDSLRKTYEIQEETKQVYIILVIERKTLFSKDYADKRHRQVSWLNSYSQFFIESLQHNRIDIAEIAKKKISEVVKDCKIFEFQKTIYKLFNKVYKRFSFKYPENQQKQEIKLKHFNDILLSIITTENEINNILILKAEEFIKSKIFLYDDKNWQIEIIKNKSIANQAATTTQAIILYFEEIFQQILACFLYLIIENEVIYSLNYDESVKLLRQFSSHDNDQYKNLMLDQKIKKIYQGIVSQSLENLKDFELKKISRIIGQERITLSFPKLFPCTTLQKNNARINKYVNDQETTIEHIIQKINGYYKTAGEEIFNQGYQEYKKLKENFITLVQNKSRFKKTFAIINNKQGLALKQIYLKDVYHIFIYNNFNRKLNFSNELSYIMRLVTPLSHIFQSHLLNLFEGKSLWINFLSICNVYNEKGLLQKFSKLIQGIKFENIDDFLLKKRIQLIKQFNQQCKKQFALTMNNLNFFGNFQIYQEIFNNVYYILEQIQSQYLCFNNPDTNISEYLRLTKNFIKTLELIEKDSREVKCKEFIQKYKQQQNIFRNLDSYLEELKKSENVKNKEDKISIIQKYQSKFLYRYWIDYIHNNNLLHQQECEIFTQKFIQRLKSQHFAMYGNYSFLVIFNNILKINPDENDINKLLDTFKTNNINNNVLLETINKSIKESKYKNQLSITLSDYLSTFVSEDAPEQQKDPNLYLLKAEYSDFQAIYKRISNNQFNQIQTIIGITFLRNYLIAYIQCLETLDINEELTRVDTILQEPKSYLSLNLRIYCLKILRKSYTIQDLQEKYLRVKRCNWIFMQQNRFKLKKQKSQYYVPSGESLKNQKQFEKLEKKFKDSKNVNCIAQMLIPNDHKNRYKLYTYFLTNVFTKQCQNKQKQIIKIIEQAKTLDPIQKNLLKRYCQSKITEKLHFKDINTFNSFQSSLLNILNLFIATKSFVSPIISIFFKNGAIPKNFEEHLSNQFVPCGIQNPFVIELQSCQQSTFKNAGFYICSNDCDYVYKVQGNGWPKKREICPYCGNNIAGDQKNALYNQNIGARRLGPNLLYNDGFQMQYSKITTDQSKFFLNQLRDQPFYWKFLAYDLEQQKRRINEKKSINIMNKESKQMKATKLTGISGIQFDQTTSISRISEINQKVLNLIILCGLYFSIELGLIQQAQYKKLFRNQQKNEYIDQLYSKIIFNYKRIKEIINHKDWIFWLNGVINHIFLQITPKFGNIVQSQQQNEKQKINELTKLKCTKQKYKALRHNCQKIQFIKRENNLTAELCFNRNLFEKCVQKFITRYLSGEQKIQLINANKCIQGETVNQLENLLMEIQMANLENQDLVFLRVLRLADPPSLEHLKLQYPLKLKQNYPILYFLLNKQKQISRIIQLFKIVEFINELTIYVEFKYGRQDLQNKQLKLFIKELALEPSKKIRLEKLYNTAIQTLPKIMEPNFLKDYAKKFDFTQTPNFGEKPKVLYFLLDTLDKNNKFGHYISWLYYILSSEQNKIINSIQRIKEQIPHLQTVRLFSNQEYNPQKCTHADLLVIDNQKVEKLVQALSAISGKYGKALPIYDFEIMQYKITTQLYGKKRLIANIQKYQSIFLIGEAFGKRVSQTNYITQARESGMNGTIENLQNLRNKFKEIAERNQNAFYNIMKNLQGFIEKLIIRYRFTRQKNVFIVDYIKTVQIKDYPKQLEEVPFKLIKIECLIHLYEQVEMCLIHKTFELLPVIYNQGDLSEIQKSQIKELHKKNQFQDFKLAFYRFTIRNLIYGEIPNNQDLLQFLLKKMDLWPYKYEKAHLEFFDNFLKSMKLSKVTSLYKQILKLTKDSRAIVAKKKYAEEQINAHKVKQKARPKKQKFRPINS